MKITDYCDIINCQLDVTYYHNQGGRWSATFNRAELKGNGILSSTYGNGGNPEEAIEDYLKKIRGSTIVFNAGDSKSRREFIVPLTIIP